MFQHFDATTRPDQGPPRLALLRAQLTGAGLDGFLVPRADAHQGEYVAPRDDRLAWLTGFTGSAGFCVALQDRAGVFIDGRYRLQVKSQVDLAAFTPVDWPETQPGPWLKSALPNGGRLGFDPWLHTASEIAKLGETLAGSDVDLVPHSNLVDAIWQDQPAPPSGRIWAFPLETAGEDAASKLKRLAAELAAAGQTAAVLTLPDSIAWLLNIRGEDIPRNPVALAFGILQSDGRVTLFIDPPRVADLTVHLGPDVTIRPPDELTAALAKLTGPVRVDKATAPLAISDILTTAGIEVAWGADPCILPKARKTDAEIAATAEAHLRDGAAMCEFLAWLDAEAPGGSLTEIDVVKALEVFRRATNMLHDISFETICGAGPNGAIVHYRVTKDTNRPVRSGELLLVDSGGQYPDGTTDITRTVAIGPPPKDARACFTRVLQGMIAISRARFPRGVAGCHLDALARAPLWMAGQDYDHGTGHGVGVFLSVHEGPARLSRVSDIPLDPGMILSNEPGYYREGAFGIRIENLIVVREAEALPGGDPRPMLDFRTLTFVPIDRRLIAVDLLSQAERDWINDYHHATVQALDGRLRTETQLWLLQATAPI